MPHRAETRLWLHCLWMRLWISCSHLQADCAFTIPWMGLEFPSAFFGNSCHLNLALTWPCGLDGLAFPFDQPIGNWEEFQREGLLTPMSGTRSCTLPSNTSESRSHLPGRPAMRLPLALLNSGVRYISHRLLVKMQCDPACKHWFKNWLRPCASIPKQTACNPCRRCKSLHWLAKSGRKLIAWVFRQLQRGCFKPPIRFEALRTPLERPRDSDFGQDSCHMA